MRGLMQVPVFQFEQPGGVFYTGVMSVKDILSIYVINTRRYKNGELVDGESLQRDLSTKKTSEISHYAQDPDATFPTPIIFSVSSDEVSVERGSIIHFNKIHGIADVIDGQHRIQGLEIAYEDNPQYIGGMVIPVVFIFDATLEQKAYIFATINSKQTKVSSSLIAELYGVTDKRTPRKVAHEIARALNASKNSPFYRRLKMLGKQSSDEYVESLSQGTFVRELVTKISSSPDEDASYVKRGELPPERQTVFNHYYRDEDDKSIFKIMVNIFNAIKYTWPEEWENSEDYILSKTAGFEAVMKALDKLVYIGEKHQDLSEDFFKSHFQKSELMMKREGIRLTSKNFPSQRTGVDKLARFLLHQH